MGNHCYVSRSAAIALLTLLLAGCTGGPASPPSAAQPAQVAGADTIVASTAAVAPTPTEPPATPTPFVFPARSEVAGVAVARLDVATAKEEVEATIQARQDRELTLVIGAFSETLRAGDFLKLPAAERLVDRARANVHGDEPVKLPLQVKIDRPALKAYLERIAPSIEQTSASEVISDADAITQTFTFARRTARRLDVDRSVTRVAHALAQSKGPRTVELLTVEADVARPPLAELERVLREHAKFWKGTAAFWVRDLESGETVAYNSETVFSGASVMKVPIMIFAYSRLGRLDDQQNHWMHKMIIDSENIEANSLLAAAVGGQGTEDALRGVEEMSAMLKSLGLEHTYQLIPYESGEWLIQQSRLPKGGPRREGAEPFTEPDPYVRTTPREMGELFAMLDECAHGRGALLEKVGGKLSPALCVEMVDWLQKPHDQERMVAGLPPGTRVAHKGGWIDDMQSDVGIVESPGGRYVAAIFIWRDGYVTDEHAHPSPYLGDFSHTIYTFFNPAPLDEARRGAAAPEATAAP